MIIFLKISNNYRLVIMFFEICFLIFLIKKKKKLRFYKNKGVMHIVFKNNF